MYRGSCLILQSHLNSGQGSEVRARVVTWKPIWVNPCLARIFFGKTLQLENHTKKREQQRGRGTTFLGDWILLKCSSSNSHHLVRQLAPTTTQDTQDTHPWLRAFPLCRAALEAIILEKATWILQKSDWLISEIKSIVLRLEGHDYEWNGKYVERVWLLASKAWSMARIVSFKFLLFCWLLGRFKIKNPPVFSTFHCLRL